MCVFYKKHKRHITHKIRSQESGIFLGVNFWEYFKFLGAPKKFKKTRTPKKFKFSGAPKNLKILATLG